MAAIGILGGMGPQASAKLVELIIAQTPNFVSSPIDSDFPEIIHLSVPVPNFISSKKNMEKAKQILLKRTKLLELSGSTVNGIACNTAHLLLPELQASTSVQFLSIPKLVSERISKEGFNRVGLLATPNTLKSTLFDEAIDKSVTLIRPTKSLSERLEKMIVKQLEGSIQDNDRLLFRKLVNNFLEANRLDAVILGCTELPLVFGESTDKTIIDTLQVLSEGLLSCFFSK